MQNPPRILLIDDEPGTTEFASRILKKQGYEVAIIESGEEALRFLDVDSSFDLIILDYLMVGLDGFETLDIIKKQNHTKHLKVLIQSGSSDASDMETAQSLGAVGYLLKPYTSIELVKEVKKVLSA